MEYFYLSRAGAVWVHEGHPRQLHQPQHAARPQRLPGEAEALKYCQQYDVDGRPLTVSFLIRASGKETDMATPLGLEKYGRIDFTLGRWVPTDPKTPKWI